MFVVPREQGQQSGFSREGTVSCYQILPLATAQTNELIKTGLQLAESLFRQGQVYKKAGVMLSDLVPDQSVQGNLFAPSGQNEQHMLMGAIDNVNFSMRDDVVKFGSSGLKRNWKMRQEMRSARHSSRWEDRKMVQ